MQTGRPAQCRGSTQIFETFTEHRDRVAILHYGGHAGGDRLFLESTGTEGAVAHAEGLATFLGQRRDLQLVFLNGCSTRSARPRGCSTRESRQ